MAEVAAVARAKGLVVPEGTEEGLIVKCTSVKEGLPSSMMFDYLAGRPMEVEVSQMERSEQGRRRSAIHSRELGRSH
jgi:ketopantoate reductase